MADGRALAEAFQGVVFDLDGVIYLVDQVIPAAPAAAISQRLPTALCRVVSVCPAMLGLLLGGRLVVSRRP